MTPIPTPASVPSLIGSHLSVAGGLVEALKESNRLGLSCCQLFTRNQRQWKAKSVTQVEASEFRRALRDRGWVDGLTRVTSHASYLINIASPDEGARQRSVRALGAELVRCEALGIRCCVLHPGAHLGEGVTKGVHLAAQSLNQLHMDLPGLRAMVCLETTVGAGTTLGSTFEELAAIRAWLRQPERIRFCIDTCHIVAAGYDCSTAERAQGVLHQFDSACGSDSLAVVHANDSMTPLGSRRDRHAHVMHGHCGEACFRAILHRAAAGSIPCILETPKGIAPDGQEWDTINQQTLQRIAAR